MLPTFCGPHLITKNTSALAALNQPVQHFVSSDSFAVCHSEKPVIGILFNHTGKAHRIFSYMLVTTCVALLSVFCLIIFHNHIPFVLFIIKCTRNAV